MNLPSKARVEAAPNFVASLAAAHAFFALQDEGYSGSGRV